MTGTVTIEGDKLVFELHGADELMAMKRRIEVPLEHVLSVSTERVPWNPFRDLRVGGTGVPGVVKDGRYVTDDGYVFFEEHDPDKCVTVSLDDERYRKVVFQVENKEAVAALISTAIESRGKPGEPLNA